MLMGFPIHKLSLSQNSHNDTRLAICSVRLENLNPQEQVVLSKRNLPEPCVRN